jgi:hypothetical protein
VWDGRAGNSEGGFSCRWKDSGKDRCAEAGLSCCASRKGEGVRRLCGRRQGGAGGFLDEASEVEEDGKGVADEGGLGGIVQAEVRRALEAEASLGGIAGFCIGLSADAEMPEVRIDLNIASQTDGAIWEGEADGEGHAEGMIRIGERAGGKRWLVRDGDVGLGLVQAFATALSRGFVNPEESRKRLERQVYRQIWIKSSG